MDNPDASRKGIITAIYYLGTWISYIFISRAASDLLGRRYAALAGIVIMCVGTALQAGASGASAFAMFIAGRIIAGIGVAIVSTSVPLYQSEIAPAKQRGKFVVMNHIGFVAGLASGFWVGYAVTFWTGGNGEEMGWRLSLSLQFVPAFIFAVGLPYLPET
jgi:MFS family permease